MPNPSNRGQTGSFAVGLAATSSEFVAFLDADDFWFPQFLQRHVEAHLNRLLSTSLSCSDLIQVDEERRVLSGTMSGPVFRERDTLAYPSIEADRCIQIDPSAAGLTFAESPGVKCIQPSYSEHPWTATSGMMFRRSALDMIMPKNPDELRICTDWYMFVLCHYLTGSLAIGSALGAYRRHGNNNFASNLIMGSGLPSTPSMLMRQHKTVISVMLNHLISQYDRLATVFPGSDAGRLVRILVTKALREDIPIQDNRLRELLGTRGMLEAETQGQTDLLPPATDAPSLASASAPNSHCDCPSGGAFLSKKDTAAAGCGDDHVFSANCGRNRVHIPLNSASRAQPRA